MICKCGIIVKGPVGEKDSEGRLLYECPHCHRIWTDLHHLGDIKVKVDRVYPTIRAIFGKPNEP
jgi:hypothetical protein